VKIGTKSVLFGAHNPVIHGVYNAIAWGKLWGIPWDPRLLLGFAVHDLGYWSSPNLEGPEGERHVELGARIVTRLFGPKWGSLCAGHSRHWARRCGRPVSRLCFADKLAFVLTPDWLYLLMTRATGELYEYMQKSRDRQAGAACFTAEESACLASPEPAIWLKGLKNYTLRWIEEHLDGREDRWTSLATTSQPVNAAK
jgi:hypothetical protein